MARERERRTTRARWLAVVAVVVSGLALGWLMGRPADVPPASAGPSARSPTRASPPRPACGRVVAPGENLQPALDATPHAAVVCLEPGIHAAPIVIRRPVVIWGPRDAVVKSVGSGTTIDIRSSKVELLGFAVDGSGGRFDLLDAAVHVQGDDVRVEGVDIQRAVFGLLLEQSRRARIVGNVVHGTEEDAIGLRGDPVRLWETNDSVVADNHVIAGRDVVIWYSSGNRIENNLVTGGRYGTHFMYSHRNEVRGNRYEANTVGVYVMYSRDVVVRDNHMLHAAGAAGIGIGLKESGTVRIEDNMIVHNRTNVLVDTTPLSANDRVLFARNTIALGETGVVFHRSERWTQFLENDFRGNLLQVEVRGNGDALGVEWRRNHFDDYAGYDLDRDGLGDVDYELRGLASDLVADRPELAFLRGTPALWLAGAISHVAPLYPPRKVLVDHEPRTSPEVTRAN